MGKQKILNFLCLVFAFACQSQKEPEISIAGFDVSHGSNLVAYAISSSTGVSIYVAERDDSTTSLILIGTKTASFFSPAFSPDGSKLAVVRRGFSELHEQDLLITDLKGNILDSMSVNPGIVTEAKFSSDGQELLLCLAKTFTHYSPIVPSAPHGVDIYSANLPNRSILKITDFNAYSLSDLEVVGNDTVLFHMIDDSSGLFLLRRSAGLIVDATPTNNPRGDSSYYYSPISCPKTNSLVFAAPYQIFTMNLTDRVADLIYDGRGKSHMYWIRVSSETCRVYFTRSGAGLSVFSVSIDGSDMRTMELQIK